VLTSVEETFGRTFRRDQETRAEQYVNTNGGEPPFAMERLEDSMALYLYIEFGNGPKTSLFADHGSVQVCVATIDVDQLACRVA
jgi:hypothetical protein